MSEPELREAGDTTSGAGLADQVEGVALNSALGADPRSLAKAWGEVVAGALEQPRLLWETGQKLQAEMLNIWFGNRDAELPADKRFGDAAWSEDPWFKRVRQSYVAWTEALDDWLAKSGLEGIERQRARFVLDAAKDVFSPVNQPLTPETLKAVQESRGESLARGVRNFTDDLFNNHGYPAIADRAAFELGKDVAATPGAVIYRNELFELIQYNPATENVHKRPLLYVFSQVNRFYLGDLTPDRSLFKELVDSGVQVFAMSWKNPGREHANWSLGHLCGRRHHRLGGGA